MQYNAKNLSKPTLSAPIEIALEVGKAALPVVQKGILDAKINKYVDREEIIEEKLKREFTILQG